MFASYSYLGLIGHPRINSAAVKAVMDYGTGTHGVRSLAGTLDLHRELEDTIAEFKGAEAAITYSSGYATNLTVVSTLLGRGDYVLSDKLNHASIVDGCLMSGAKFLRFRHNDMESLEQRLQQVPGTATKATVSGRARKTSGPSSRTIPPLPARSRRRYVSPPCPCQRLRGKRRLKRWMPDAVCADS